MSTADVSPTDDGQLAALPCKSHAAGCLPDPKSIPGIFDGYYKNLNSQTLLEGRKTMCNDSKSKQCFGLCHGLARGQEFPYKSAVNLSQPPWISK